MSVASKAGRLAGALAAFVCVATTAGADDLAQLQREWWQWIMATPASHSPVYDKTGKFCTMGQRGEYWFLAGSTGGRVTRSCTVPRGVKLLVPVVNNFCFPDPGYDNQQCVEDSIAFIDGFPIEGLTLRLDGEDQEFTRVTDAADPAAGTIFDIAVGPNGYGGVKPGVYRVNAADGYWGVIETGGLSGDVPHVIEIGAQGPAFGLSVTYLVRIVEPSN